VKKGKGWYGAFALLLVVSSVTVYAVTGQDALGAAGRFLWNGLVLAANVILRTGGSVVSFVARGIGLRRVSRLFSALATVGIGYAASVVVSDATVIRARGWRGKLHAGVGWARQFWHGIPLVVKLIVVVGLIASQIYLHILLVIFPIAFLVPVVRKLWVRVADLLFGSWYWKTFGATHRALLAALKRFPSVRIVTEGARLQRLRYLYAWRLWRYDPRYRDPVGNTRHVSLVEPLRLWLRGELDGYVGRPLLSGRRSQRQHPAGIARLSNQAA
jgi:hypothetical protein